LTEHASDWRLYDDDYTAEQIAMMPQKWRQLYAAAKASAESLPWLYVTDGTNVIAEPFPVNEDDAVERIEEIAGENP
jgi:hypothetical protein